MRILAICACVVMILQPSVVGATSGSPLPPPFDTEPFDTDATGNAGADLLGAFRQDGGPKQFRYGLGTNFIPGSLRMDFAVRFTDGPGNDFAISTNSESWGPLADTALFEFYLGGSLQASFTASLAPDQVFQFDLPGSGLIADRVIVTNITPDPPGINDLATMTFDDAGVAYPITTTEVAIDIKPQSCPNPLNVKSKGVLPVAIMGTATFKVTQVDPASIKLEGVSPLRWALEDVGKPFVPFTGKKKATDCTTAGPDGHKDLTLKFDTQAVAAALGAVMNGQVRVLKLTGKLKPQYGGTPIAGEDVVVILKK